MKKRSRAQVIRDILKIASKGARKTTIMYKANLNFKRLDNYLQELIEEGLVTVTNEPRPFYRITDKGKELINIISNADKIFIL
jgi:predicted transcriptional regulator